MLKLILAYILSIAMGAGTAELPAVPESMSRLAIENVVITIDDESYALDSRLLLGAAVGEDEALLNFCLENNGSRLFPIDAKITAEELMFAISEVGSAFRITDEAIIDMLDIPEDFLPADDDVDDVNIFINGVNFSGAQEIPPEEMEEVIAVTEDFLAAHENAAASEGSIAMEGTEYPGRTIVIENCIPAFLDLADYFVQNDHGAITEEFKAILEEYNHLMDEEITSFREMYTFEDEIPNVRLEYTGADIGDERAQQAVLSMNEDGMQVELTSLSYKGRETGEMIAVMREEGYASEMKMDFMLEEAEDGESMAAKLNTSINDATDMGDGSKFCSTMNFSFDAEVDDARGELHFDMDDIYFNRYGDGSIVYTFTENYGVDLELTSNEDDVHIKADLAADLEGRDLDLGLELDLAFSEEPYASPFEGKKIVDFASEQELMESGQFISDSMAFGLDAMRIGVTTDASRIAAMAQQLMTPPAMDPAEYAAMGAEFGVQLPEFRLPEGWNVQDVDIFQDELSIYCANEEDYFEVTVTRADEENGSIRFMLLNEEGRLVPAEGGVVEYFYGINGEVRGAMIYHNGMMMEFDFPYAEKGFGETVIDGIVWAE